MPKADIAPVEISASDEVRSSATHDELAAAIDRLSAQVDAIDERLSAFFQLFGEKGIHIASRGEAREIYQELSRKVEHVVDEFNDRTSDLQKAVDALAADLKADRAWAGNG